MMITEHVLTKDGDPTPIAHLWLDARSPEVNAGLRSCGLSRLLALRVVREPIDERPSCRRSSGSFGLHVCVGGGEQLSEILDVFDVIQCHGRPT